MTYDVNKDLVMGDDLFLYIYEPSSAITAATDFTSASRLTVKPSTHLTRCPAVGTAIWPERTHIPLVPMHSTRTRKVPTASIHSLLTWLPVKLSVGQLHSLRLLQLAPHRTSTSTTRRWLHTVRVLSQVFHSMLETTRLHLVPSPSPVLVRFLPTKTVHSKSGRLLKGMPPFFVSGCLVPIDIKHSSDGR